MREDESVVCRICHTALGVYDWPDRPTEYRHSDTIKRQYGRMVTDHQPDPIVGVATDDIIGVCDFCGAKRPRWTYPCQSFQALELPNNTGMGMIADWAACHICYELIEHDQWDLLANRSADNAPFDMWAATQLAVRILHQQFKAHRTGPAIDNRVTR